MIETSLLQTLVAAGKTGSFSKAAEKLHVTQSAISQSVKNLEKKVGVKLFARTGKKIMLTPEGEKLYELGNEVLSRINDTISEIRENKEAMTGVIRIGTLAGLGKSWLGPLLINFSSQFPDLKIEVCLDLPAVLVKKFERFELDCLVISEETTLDVGQSDVLYEEKATLVFPNSKDFPIGPGITLDELLNYPLLLFDSNAPLFIKWCKVKYGKVPRNISGRFIINSHGNMLHAVSQGLGIAVVPDHVLKRSYFKDKVSTLGEDSVCMINKILHVYRKESIELTRMQKLREILTSDSILT